jgi:hypothetical protein
MKRKALTRLLPLCILILLCIFVVVLYETTTIKDHVHTTTRTAATTTGVSISTITSDSNLRSTEKSSGKSDVIVPSHSHGDSSNAVLRTILQNPPQKSRYAYTTLISGIDKSMKYKGFLLNALIMLRSLRSLGSTADFIAMIGFRDEEYQLYVDDINLLIKNGIIVHVLPRLLNKQFKLSFAEMALLKVTPYNFTEYEKVQFFDGDIMPTKNMDCLFELPFNSFTVGAASPLNSGWFLAIPNTETYDFFISKALWRLQRDWDQVNGWGSPMPPQGNGLQYRGGLKDCTLWDFNGADMDQGLFTHNFILTKGNGLLIDTDKGEAKIFHQGLLTTKPDVLTADKVLSMCNGMLPTAAFSHFTGRSKPWMNDPKVKKRGRDWNLWMRQLDSLQLPINSSNILTMDFGSSLGFFNANFPKGGYQKKG